ncbi:GntR family transcriptional regulator [Streptomyces sp. NPDC048518]|uniref:GntR family transcriptional regulator n=1 Tax=Streptomyces sp. NPDC048518 TaxID=3155029 RepID=UPI0033F59093
MLWDVGEERGVSLAVVREALVRPVGEGLADRLPNHGFAVPAVSDRRPAYEPRTTACPAPSRAPVSVPEEGAYYSGAWAEAHRVFHRPLLEGCGNPVLLDTFDRMWTASEPARRLSTHRHPDRDGAAEHRRLEEAAPARDADTAAEVLAQHLTRTAADLTGCACP